MDYQEYAQKEREAYAAFKKSYEEKHPKPRLGAGEALKSDPLFWYLLLVSIASILLASFRTADIFFQSAANAQMTILGVNIAVLESAVALFAIEGGMVAYSISLSRKNGTVHGTTWYYIGIVMLAAISVVAGLGQSITLTPNPPEWLVGFLQYGLIIMIGPGAALSAVIAGHIIGSRIGEVQAKNDSGYEQWKAEVAEWHDRLNSSWNANKGRIVGAYGTSAPAQKKEQKRYPRREYGQLKSEIEDWLSSKQVTLHSRPVDDAFDYKQVARDIDADPKNVRKILERLRNA